MTFKFNLMLLFLTLITNTGILASDQNTEDFEKKVALVIGNSDYKEAPLKNPVHDAEDIASSLKKSGFQVIKLTNSTKAQIKAGVRKFESQISKGHVGLFFFAGHGIQVNGENYIVPIGASIYKKYDIDDQCIKLSYILGAMEMAENKMNIIILDACRNNPFRSYRSSMSGLSKMDAPTGSILIYSTAPGRAAEDGSGRNSTFTTSFLKYLKVPNISLTSMLMKVRKDVMIQSGNTQVPWESSSLTSDFYFNTNMKNNPESLPEPVSVSEARQPDPMADSETRQSDSETYDKSHPDQLTGIWVDEWEENGRFYYTLIRLDQNGKGYTEYNIPEDPWWVQKINWHVEGRDLITHEGDPSSGLLSKYRFDIRPNDKLILTCIGGDSKGDKLTLVKHTSYTPKDIDIKNKNLTKKWYSKWTKNGYKCMDGITFYDDGTGYVYGYCKDEDWEGDITWKRDDQILTVTSGDKSDFFMIRCLNKKNLCLIDISPGNRYDGSTYKRKIF